MSNVLGSTVLKSVTSGEQMASSPHLFRPTKRCVVIGSYVANLSLRTCGDSLIFQQEHVEDISIMLEEYVNLDFANKISVIVLV
ncbi:hypothetical protein CDAR_412411 [Caerostris darwini]|uniref:Uncharacterized protein n=1 Tax=Caerostris darwini TaxID=1538125 RepID=A0AAV4SYU2_9ARAC|nr:hypothetical protein CDAR_412411 [Caerostris darwini]